MHLSPSTGEFTIENQLSLGAGTTFDEALKLLQKWEPRPYTMNEERSGINVHNIPDGEDYITLGLAFDNGLLRNISIHLSKEPFVEGQGWENWSEQKEMELLEMYRSWLHRELGELNNFEWGNVLAEYNPKNAYTSLTVSYNPL